MRETQIIGKAGLGRIIAIKLEQGAGRWLQGRPEMQPINIENTCDGFFVLLSFYPQKLHGIGFLYFIYPELYREPRRRRLVDVIYSYDDRVWKALIDMIVA